MDRFLVRTACAKRKIDLETNTPNDAKPSNSFNDKTNRPENSNKSESQDPQPSTSFRENSEKNEDIRKRKPSDPQPETDQGSLGLELTTAKKQKNDKFNDQPRPTNDSNQGPSTTKKQKKMCFNDNWLSNPSFRNWLQKSEDSKGNTVARCKVCQCTLICHKSTLHKHTRTAKHASLVKAGSQRSLSECINPKIDLARRAELKLAAFLANNNLSFNLLDTMIPLLKDIFNDSDIAKNMTLGRTKGQALITQVLGPQCKKELTDKLKVPGQFFSAIIDETTDITTNKQCALSVISTNENNQTETFFYDLYEVQSGTGQHLQSEMLKKFTDENIPLDNLVGFASDTTNSMVGAHNSVFSHLKERIPDIACVKCSSHMIHLVASKACMVLPRSVEDMLRNVGSHFSRSSHRQKRLEDLQVFFKEDIHKILSPCTTRWLSLIKCVDRVLEQKEVLKEYFKNELISDPSLTTETILNTLNNSYTTIYLEFMSYVLGMFTDFNKLFQSERPLLHRLKIEIEKLLRNIMCNYLEFAYIKRSDVFKVDYDNPRRFVDINKVYLGVAAQQSIAELKSKPNPPPQAEIEAVQSKCLAFYIEAIKEIKTRFTFEDPLYDCISIVNPDVAQSYKQKDLTEIFKRFPILNQFTNREEIVKEWREHAFLNHQELGLLPDMPAEEYWRKVFLLKNCYGETLLPNLKKVLSLLLVLPFSNACVERVFSKLKLIKTDHRNKLHTTTIAALMNTAQATKNGLIEFQPSQTMMAAKLKY